MFVKIVFLNPENNCKGHQDIEGHIRNEKGVE